MADPAQTAAFHHTGNPVLVAALSTVALSCNIVLNFFGIINIVVRLLLHRRSIVATFGRPSNSAKESGRISGILLGSAALNIPVTLLAVTCVFVEKPLMSIAATVTLHGQVRFEHQLIVTKLTIFSSRFRLS